MVTTPRAVILSVLLKLTAAVSLCIAHVQTAFDEEGMLLQQNLLSPVPMP